MKYVKPTAISYKKSLVKGQVAFSKCTSCGGKCHKGAN